MRASRAIDSGTQPFEDEQPKRDLKSASPTTNAAVEKAAKEGQAKEAERIKSARDSWNEWTKAQRAKAAALVGNVSLGKSCLSAVGELARCPNGLLPTAVFVLHRGLGVNPL